MRLFALLLLLVALPGCSLVYRLALPFVYDHADLPDENVRLALPYVDGSDDPKHRYNLFLPLADSVRAEPWPTVIYVHGGGWTEGDRDLRFGGEDLYGNIGRFFASRGIGAAVISYRLQPGATWREQVHDVARATAAIRERVRQEGGHPDGLVLMGHSAGAHLASHVALDPKVRNAAGLPEAAVCGVIPVSGAAYDLTDTRSFEIRPNYPYYVQRFAPPGGEHSETVPAEPAPWQVAASVVPLLTPEAPSFQVLYAEGDYPALIRQAEVLLGALDRANVPHEEVIVPGSSHERIIAALSKADYVAGPAMLRFVRGLEC
ncbi:MAG: alpha/beta hydrolase [Bacteroidota bacterium]